tara:strand:- start:755 stop:1336 length:582 start_codon:yes stop_codon:yes gene_type:complete
MANLQIQNITTLEDQGKALAEEWEVITKGDKRRFNKSTKTDGFDTKLGQLMVELKAEGGERIASQRLRDCHLHLISKQRRAEALWFVENEDAARKFIAESKKGYTSLSALQKAFTKSNKPKAEDTEDTNSEADVKSDVGPTASDGGTVTAEEVFKHLVAVCKHNQIDLLDIAEMLMEVDTVSEAEAEETKVAA